MIVPVVEGSGRWTTGHTEKSSAATSDEPQARPPLPNSNAAHITLRVIPNPSPGGLNIFDRTAPLTAATVERFRPDPAAADRAADRLNSLHLSAHRSDWSITTVASVAEIEKHFGVKLERLPGAVVNGHKYPTEEMPFFPLGNVRADGAHGIAGFVFPALAEASAEGRHQVRENVRAGAAPHELPGLVNADRVHRELGARGKQKGGAPVRVAQLDSGFAWEHPWFGRYRANGQLRAVRRRPPQNGNPATGYLIRGSLLDTHGHGTAMSACLLGLAPDVHLTGIQTDLSAVDPNTLRASSDLLSALELALDLEDKPDVIFFSVVLRLAFVPGARRLPPDNLTATEAVEKNYELLMLRALNANVVVVGASGNTDRAAPGPDEWTAASYPLTITVGGVSVTGGTRVPSALTLSYAPHGYADAPLDAFVPDCCGPCGESADDWCYALPIPNGNSYRGGWRENRGADGWFVHTAGASSAATAVVAGVAALVRACHVGLAPGEVRRRLRRATAVGSGPGGRLVPGFAGAPAGHDARTGHGLVDAYRAVS